jgi:hypothetical protein
MKLEWDWDPECWSWGKGHVQGWSRPDRLNYMYDKIHLGPLTIRYHYKEWKERP